MQRGTTAVAWRNVATRLLSGTQHRRSSPTCILLIINLVSMLTYKLYIGTSPGVPFLHATPSELSGYLLLLTPFLNFNSSISLFYELSVDTISFHGCNLMFFIIGLAIACWSIWFDYFRM